MKNYVFDANALITYMENRAGAEKVQHLLDGAEDRKLAVFMSVVNLGEVFYATWKMYGEQEARLRLQQVLGSPILLVTADLDVTVRSAELKAKFKCAYADAFAASVAVSKRATLVTADPDFKRFGDKFKVLWLPSHKSIN